MHLKIFVFIFYNLILILAAIAPLRSMGVGGLNQTYVASMRLDHLLHLAAFFPWVMLADMLFCARKLWRIILLVAAAVFVSAATELVQLCLSYRAYNPMDLKANVAGVLLGALFWLILRGPILRTKAGKLFFDCKVSQNLNENDA